MKYGRIVNGLFLAAAIVVAAMVAPDHEFLGVVTKVKGAVLFKNSHSDKAPKAVRVGLTYYPGYEFLTPKGGYLELLDQNVGKRITDKGDAVWKRATLKLNDTQKELVAHLSDMGWSVSRDRGSGFIEIPSHSSRMPLDSLTVVRNPDAIKEPLKLTILANDDHRIFFTGQLPQDKPTFQLPAGTRKALRRWAGGNERVVTFQFDSAEGSFTRRVHLLSTAQLDNLSKGLRLAENQNQLTRILMRAKAFETSGCNDLAALTLSKLAKPQFSTDELAVLRQKPFIIASQ